MKSNSEIFQEFRAKLIETMFSSQEYLEAKASGNFESFVRGTSSYVITDLKYTQLGTEYTKVIDQGRGAGGVIRKQIYEWLKFKKYGLDWSTDSERKSLAFLISRKIAREGSYKHRNTSARTKIVENAVNKNIPELLDSISKNEANKLGVKIGKLYGD